MRVMDSSQSIGVFSTVCMKAVTPLTRNSVNLLVQLEKSWVSITLTVTNPFTTPWSEWRKSSRFVIRWLMARVILVRLTATHPQLCDIPKVGSTGFPSTCSMISTRRPSISNRTSMTQSKNQPFFPLVCQTYCSTAVTVLQLEWQLAFRLII